MELSREQVEALAAIEAIRATASQETMATPEQKEAMATIRTWKSDVNIREEFRGDFESYCFYREAMAAGRVKVYGNRTF